MSFLYFFADARLMQAVVAFKVNKALEQKFLEVRPHHAAFYPDLCVRGVDQVAGASVRQEHVQREGRCNGASGCLARGDAATAHAG